MAIPCDPDAPKRRPQQQQDADGAVKAGELVIKIQSFGEFHGRILTRAVLFALFLARFELEENALKLYGGADLSVLSID
jgi:hypothetical protein